MDETKENKSEGRRWRNFKMEKCQVKFIKQTSWKHREIAGARWVFGSIKGLWEMKFLPSPHVLHWDVDDWWSWLVDLSPLQCRAALPETEPQWFKGLTAMTDLCSVGSTGSRGNTRSPDSRSSSSGPPLPSFDSEWLIKTWNPQRSPLVKKPKPHQYVGMRETFTKISSRLFFFFFNRSNCE